MEAVSGREATTEDDDLRRGAFGREEFKADLGGFTPLAPERVTFDLSWWLVDSVGIRCVCYYDERIVPSVFSFAECALISNAAGNAAAPQCRIAENHSKAHV